MPQDAANVVRKVPGQSALACVLALQINCQLIVDRDRIDFVQLRVRVRSEDFIGITAIKDSKKVRRYITATLPALTPTEP